jgi:hypothetical protein
MNRLALALLASAFFAAGCAASPAATTAKTADRADASETDRASATETGAASSERREVGDYVTFAFSGAYRDAPITLTQRVIARSEDAIEIEYTFVEKGESETMRVTTSVAGETAGTIARVERIAADGSTEPATTDAFEARIGETAASTDQNEALLDERQTTVKVGSAELTATTTTYQVKIGDETATLETTASEDFAWGDLGGKITTADGKVYFSAELVDAGDARGAQAALEP